MPLAFCRLEVPRQHRWAFAQYAELCAGFLERPKDEIGRFLAGLRYEPRPLHRPSPVDGY